MKPDEELVIDIDEVGRPTFTVNGVEGTDCLMKSKPFEDALAKDGEAPARVAKPEMARTAKRGNTVNLRAGGVK